MDEHKIPPRKRHPSYYGTIQKSQQGKFAISIPIAYDFFGSGVILSPIMKVRLWGMDVDFVMYDTQRELGKAFNIPQQNITAYILKGQLLQEKVRSGEFTEEDIWGYSPTKQTAEAIVDYANKLAKKPHKHWYFGFDKHHRVTFYPEEVGLYQDKAVRKTLETIKKQIAKELEPIIALRSQGIWVDYWTDKDGKKHHEEMGCSVVPTREVIKFWEKLTGKEHKVWRRNADQ